MESKKNILLTIALMFFVVLAVYSIPMASAQEAEATWCAERTLGGAYCQNVPIDEIDQDFLSSPTSCESTSFCQRGCCYDGNEGICAENVPEKACEINNGFWSDSPNCQIPQCELGCCVLGTEASFTSLQRCKKIAGNFGLEANFRTDIADEFSCIELATSQDIGACVFESDFTRTCKFLTRGECNSQGVGDESVGATQFYEDFLCTAEELNTNCQKTTRTSCIDGKDGVYYLDTCGNPANIYDSESYDNVEYWSRVVPRDRSCQAGSRTCGNCDYLGGSICGEAERGSGPVHGEVMCNDINCYDTHNGNNYVNGESWCFFDNDDPDSATVGSRHYRHTCFMGEEIVEACGDFRSDICIEGEIELQSATGGGGDSFAQAGCVVNRWQDCILQKDKDDCENTDQRYCKWIQGSTTGSAFDNNNDNGRCVPAVASGLEFWNEGAKDHCSIATSVCVVVWEEDITGDADCVENCHCLEEGYKESQKNICNAVGDCGADINYVNVYVDKGYEFDINDEQTIGVRRRAANPGGPTPTGNVIQGFVVKTYDFLGGNA